MYSHALYVSYTSPTLSHTELFSFSFSSSLHSIGRLLQNCNILTSFQRESTVWRGEGGGGGGGRGREWETEHLSFFTLFCFFIPVCERETETETWAEAGPPTPARRRMQERIPDPHDRERTNEQNFIPDRGNLWNIGTRPYRSELSCSDDVYPRQPLNS